MNVNKVLKTGVHQYNLKSVVYALLTYALSFRTVVTYKAKKRQRTDTIRFNIL